MASDEGFLKRRLRGFGVGGEADRLLLVRASAALLSLMNVAPDVTLSGAFLTAFRGSDLVTEPRVYKMSHDCNQRCTLSSGRQNLVAVVIV